jgi:PKD repeat protein
MATPDRIGRSGVAACSLLAHAMALALTVMVPVQIARPDTPAAPASEPPTCDISYSPDNPTTEDVISFYANASDPDGTIVDHYWTFGDGSPTLGGDPVIHQYTQADTYDVTLEVVDDAGDTGLCYETITVTEPICAIAGPDQLLLGEDACFACTIGPGVSIVSWHWDLGDFSTATGADVCHTYETYGSYLVTLVVTDDTGVSSPCSQHVIEVKAPIIEVSTEFSRGWHMVSLPLEPVDPDPAVVFAGIPISGNLHRYDHGGQQYVTYYDFVPGLFGDLAVSEGYWFYCHDPAGCRVQYQAYNNRQESVRELTTPGWYMVGASMVTNDFDGVVLSSDTDACLFPEAANVWVQDPLVGYDNLVGAYYTAGMLPTDDDHYLRPWQGYWVYAFEQNLALVIPGDQPPYPKIIMPEDGGTVSGHALVVATDLQAVPPYTINSAQFEVYLDGVWQPIKGIWDTGEPKDVDLPPWENIWDTTDMATGDYPLRMRVDTAYGEFSHEITVHVNKEPAADFAVSLSDHNSVVFDGSETSPNPSYDPEDGANIGYGWHFSDDATIQEGAVVEHAVPVPGSPEAPYEFSVELEVNDTEGAVYEKHQMITVEYNEAGLPDVVYSYDKSCGCCDMDIKDSGQSWADLWWMPERKKRARGPYATTYQTSAGRRCRVHHNFDVIAMLSEHSDPSRCREVQGVQRTGEYGGRSYPKRGRLLKSDGNLGGWVDCPDTGGWGDYCDDDCRAPDNKIKFHVDQSWVFWVDGPGFRGLERSDLPASYEATFVAAVRGDQGWCQCTWRVQIYATTTQVTSRIVEKDCRSGF